MLTSRKLLCLHTSALHLGFIGCYGNDEVLTPNLDRLADEGVVFDQHIADHPKIGASPLPDAWRKNKVTVRHLDLSRLLWNNRLVKRAIHQLDSWAHEVQRLMWIDFPALAPPWQVPKDLFAESFPAADDEEEPLSPWLDPPIGSVDAGETASLRLQLTYAAAMTAFDAWLGQIIEHLRDQGRLDEMIVCVTGSSGLALGEHGYVGEHRAWLHEEVVHVPLIVRMPEVRERGLRISALTQPADLLATLADVVGLPPSGDGKSLVPLIRGDVNQVRSFASAKLRIGDSEEWALRNLDWHLVVPISCPDGDPPRSPQLFVKPDDRWEVNDVRQQHLELAEELETLLRDRLKDSKQE